MGPCWKHSGMEQRAGAAPAGVQHPHEPFSPAVMERKRKATALSHILLYSSKGKHDHGYRQKEGSKDMQKAEQGCMGTN